MKNYLLIFFICVSFFANAQITINSTDFYSPNDTARTSYLESLTGIDTNLTGANAIWDFTNLQPLSQNLDTFFSPASAGTIYAVVFANPLLPDYLSTYAIQRDMFSAPIPGVTIEEPWGFIKNKTDHQALVGFGATINGTKIPARYDDIDTIYHFPLNYGDVDTCESYFELEIPTLATIKEWKTRYNEVDGWGMLSTPYGTFPAIRVKSILFIKDSVYYSGFPMAFERREVEYKWLSTNEADLLLQITTRNMGTASIIYKDSIRPYLGINELNINNNISVFPNPADNIINIAFQANSQMSNTKLQVFDISGKLIIYKSLGEIRQGEHEIQLNVENLATGLYNVSIASENEIFKTKSFIIK
jgi:Secretion system C-terminal sorting domain